jgi:hypothetical protein
MNTTNRDITVVVALVRMLGNPDLAGLTATSLTR